jgi:hypothetical protein
MGCHSTKSPIPHPNTPTPWLSQNKTLGFVLGIVVRGFRTYLRYWYIQSYQAPRLCRICGFYFRLYSINIKKSCLYGRYQALRDLSTELLWQLLCYSDGVGGSNPAPRIPVWGYSYLIFWNLAYLISLFKKRFYQSVTHVRKTNYTDQKSLL